jgi:hypothetical protein
MSDDAWTLGTGEFRRRRGRAHGRACFTIPGVLPGEPAHYTCYDREGAVTDHGTITCLTSRACGDFSC